jgi:type IV pilus assembly protein PilM
MFKKKRNVTAVDIGANSVKLVELSGNREAPVVVRAGETGIAWPDNADRQNPDQVRQHTAVALRALFSQTGLNPSRIANPISAVPGDKISIKQIRSVSLSASELDSSLAFEARKHVPVEGEALMDYQVLNDTGTDLDILLCVTARRAVQDHLDFLAQCGVRGKVIDAPPLAVVNARLLNPAAGPMPGTAMFIHVGASLTHLCILRQGGLFFVREIPHAGDHFTREISSKEGVGLMEAERLKREKGILSGNGKGRQESETGKIGFAEAEAGTIESLDGLVTEIHRSVRFYAKETGDNRIDETFLSGGSAADAGLRERLASALRRECRVIDPFEGLKVKCQLPAGGRTALTQAVGMALRGIHDVFQNKP